MKTLKEPEFPGVALRQQKGPRISPENKVKPREAAVSTVDRRLFAVRKFVPISARDSYNALRNACPAPAAPRRPSASKFGGYSCFFSSLLEV